MIGVDTNVLVRYLTQDDAAQSVRAGEILEDRCSEESPALLSAIVLVELFWVLSRGYMYRRAEIVRAFEVLVSRPVVAFEHTEAVLYAFHVFRGGRADFADALIGRLARFHDCETTYTLDQAAAALPDFTKA